MPGMVVQMRDREDGAAARVGFTATRKLGNAVVRNRVKRRLREVARRDLARRARPGCDYVLIGRPASATRPFADLEHDLNSALNRLHRRLPVASDRERP